MKKKMLALFLSLAACFSLPLAVQAAEEDFLTPTTDGAAPSGFFDVPSGSWFEEGVTTCAQKGIMVGTGKGLFSPNSELTAAECLTLAVRLYDLNHGGDGVLEKAPEDWGKMLLTLEDGTVFQGYGENSTFIWWGWKNGNWGVQVLPPGETEAEREAWGKAHEGPATMTVDGVEYQGSVRYWLPVTQFMLVFSTENESTRDILHAAVFSNIPAPDQWYRNTVYTAHQLGLNDETHFPGFSTLLQQNLTGGGSAFRREFSLALAEAAGELSRLYTVETLPDLERTGNEAVWGLYEAGVLTGMDEYGRFGANSSLTRAQAAVMVARVLDESQRVSTPPQEGGTYAQAVAELRNRMGYHNEQTFDTDLCTIFLYDLGGMMHAPTGAIQIICKPGSPLGDGYVLNPPHVRSGWSVTPPDTMSYDPETESFTYSYFYDATAYDSSIQGLDTRVEPGSFTFTVDLVSGNIRREYRPIDYAGAMAHVTRKRISSAGEHSENREVLQTLETDQCTVVLTKGRFVDKYDDYILSLVYKPGSALGDGTIKRLLLPSTVYDMGYPWYVPTDQAPDSLEVSQDGTTLTYVYHFSKALEDFHDAGTYTYTVDLTTGELSVTHIEE